MAMNRLKGFGNAWVILSLSLLVLTSCVSEVKRYSQDSKVAVVLGAGASKGFAHVGVLKILEANQIPIHMIVGTSAGSFVGSLYAYGYDAFELQKMSFEMVKGDVVDMMIIPDRGFIKGKKLENFINEKVQNTPVERLKIPFYPVATDIQNGEEIVFISGNTGRAVRASCSVPGVFRPVTINKTG